MSSSQQQQDLRGNAPVAPSASSTPTGGWDISGQIGTRPGCLQPGPGQEHCGLQTQNRVCSQTLLWPSPNPAGDASRSHPHASWAGGPQSSAGLRTYSQSLVSPARSCPYRVSWQQGPQQSDLCKLLMSRSWGHPLWNSVAKETQPSPRTSAGKLPLSLLQWRSGEAAPQWLPWGNQQRSE